MGPFFFRGILWLCFLTATPLPAVLLTVNISSCEAERIGQAIYWNECSGKKERLVWWNAGENFASLGIGHFIWYPKDKRGPFEETFPSLLCFFQEHNVKLPLWLNSEDACPWNTQEEFLGAAEKAKKGELQELLSKTIPLQTAFLGQRLEKTLPRILASMNEETRKAALKHIDCLKTTLQGKFALIDYLNFKGTGMVETERYQGMGWGLKQILEEMPTHPDNTLKAFCDTAKMLLKRRVKGAPAEERWLQGWLCRIERYAQFT
jgi:hypothetical protein